MTDREIMLHRFSTQNIKKNITKCAEELSMDREDYVNAVERGLKEENEQRKNNNTERI